MRAMIAAPAHGVYVTWLVRYCVCGGMVRAMIAVPGHGVYVSCMVRYCVWEEW